MNRYASLFLSSALILFVPFSVSRAQDPLSVDKEHVAGVIEAHLASLEACRKGDVLIRSTSSGHGRYYKSEDQEDGKSPIKYVEGPDASSLAVEVDSLVRIVFDFDKQKALAIVRSREQRQVFDALDKSLTPTKENVDFELLLNDPGVGTLMPNANGDTQIFDTFRTAQDVLDFVGPDWRTLGLGPPGSWEKHKKKFTALANTDAIASISNVGKNTYQMTYLGKDYNEGRISKFDWDLARNVPIKFWLGSERVGVLHEGTARWRSIKGQLVPISSRYMDRKFQRLNGRSYRIHREVAFDLHWFSFNEELADDLFDAKLLTNHEKINEMLNVDVFEENDDATTREKRN